MSDETRGWDIGGGSKQILQASAVVVGTASGEKYTPTLSTSGTLSTGSAEQTALRGRHAASAAPHVQPKYKHASHALFVSCLESLDRAIDNSADFFLRNNSLEQLRDTLSELWTMRAHREEDFAELVNMLQGIFLNTSVESFSDVQLHVIRDVFQRLAHEEGTFDDDFANAITMDLLKGGVDVFRELD
jgi:hypothetical protein